MTVARARRGRLLGGAAALFLCVSGGCRSETSPSKPAPGGAGPPESGLVASVRRAEYARAPGDVPEAGLSSRDPAVRRVAAAALARSLDAAAFGALKKLLADEDPEVVAWAAYGLGLLCEGREPETVRALVARAASWVGGAPGTSEPERLAVSLPSAVSDAVSRCGTDEGESTLRAWLDVKPLAAAAARSLGRKAAGQRRLADTTIVALIDHLGGPVPLLPAFDAFARLKLESSAARSRLLKAATDVATSGRGDRTGAIFALAAVSEGAAPLLSSLVLDEHRPAVERSAAALTLAKLAPPVPRLVGETLARMVPKAPDDAWITASTGMLLPLIDAAGDPEGPTHRALERLATLPKGQDAASTRRRAALRCAASAALSSGAKESERLATCDFGARGRPWALSTLRVLDRGALEGARRDRWSELLGSPDGVVQRQALAVIPRHPELSSLDEILASHLVAKWPGVVAEAARVVATLAGRAATSGTDPKAAPAPSAKLVNAVARALEAERPPDQIEPRARLIGAAAALGALSLKPRVEPFCRSGSSLLRAAAERALGTLGGSPVSCPRPKGLPVDAPLPPQPAHTLTFVTDMGRVGMTLDPTLAPLAVARVVELAKGGFYDELAVHRVVPGSIVQFGDPGGDGYGGAGRDPLPSETSPAEFDRLTVGLALAGPDTGSSQIFVTVASAPHLYGDYPVLGWADPDWALLQEGDVIHRVEVRP